MMKNHVGVFSDCYRILSDISYGLASKEIDSTQSYFFYKCLHKLSLRLKKEDLSEHRAFLNSIDDFAQLNQVQPGEKVRVLPKPVVSLIEV